ncbi:MAG TPA: hypothetical protein VHZ78_13140 [Rhizomicrobium sp.]|jgi:hypothetical protein|nr:hypothetical protein [Rhizomicrobium sp.]
MGRNSIRAFICAAVFLFGATPATSSSDDGTLACKLIDRHEMETILGAPIGPLKGQAMNICAGLCASLNSSICQFPVLLPSSPEPPQSWTLWVYQPPFEPGNWPATVRTIAKSTGRDKVDNVDWRGGSALWDYDPANARGILSVFIQHRVFLTVVQESGVRNSSESLSSARAIAARALVHFDRQ